MSVPHNINISLRQCDAQYILQPITLIISREGRKIPLISTFKGTFHSFPSLNKQRIKCRPQNNLEEVENFHHVLKFLVLPRI